MKKLISLDISSSTIGWAVFEFDDVKVKLVETGHIKPLDKKKSGDCLPKRLNDTKAKLDAILSRINPDEIAIEDYAKRFNKGRSTINTIILLAIFNETCNLVCYDKTNKDSFKYPVISIRATLGKFFQEKIVSKDDLFPMIMKKCKNFKIALNKKGIMKKELFDECDAIAVGICHILKTSKTEKVWDL